MTARRFISHRGVNLDSTVSGENSLEAVELARRAGFTCIETDVRLTSDGVFVIMHDETLNRTATTADGRELDEAVYVDSVPFESLKNDYRVKARDPHNRTQIPSLEEYLQACAAAELMPFIEVKLDDQPASFYRELLGLADRILGRGGYVMTSHGGVNRTIRQLGVHDVPLMDILYLAPSFDDVVALGNVIMAISATRYTRDEHLALVHRTRLAGLATEVHADSFETFAIANDHGIDLISTDLLVPDLAPTAERVRTAELYTGGFVETEGELRLADAPHVRFGGMYFDAAIMGSCEVRLGPQSFTVSTPTSRRFRHQVMVFDDAAEFSIRPTPETRIDALRLTIAEF